MRHSKAFTRDIVASLLVCGIIAMAACTDPAQPSSTTPSITGPIRFGAYGSSDIHVSTVDSLYSAVNNADNAGKRIVLDSGTYYLDSTAMPTKGLLVLQHDMTLAGPSGHPDFAVIDASRLPASSFGAPATGAVRVGRGANSIEWLTVQNATKAAAGIEADLFESGPTLVRVSHVVVSGNQRGVDIKNQGTSAGRALEVEITDTEMKNAGFGQGQGIRLVNSSSAGASIHALLQRNYLHDNLVGLLAANLQSVNSSVTVDSYSDQFTGNGNGMILLGGLSTSASVSDFNTTAFNAHALTVTGNKGARTGSSPGPGGIMAQGGSTTLADKASSDSLFVELWGSTMGDNNGPDVKIWGAQNSGVGAVFPAGSYNFAIITVHGSLLAIADPINSDPVEPAGTNKALVVQY